MPLPPLDNANHWRKRAAEMRALADDYKDKKAAEIMNRLADDYDRLADHAEERAKHGWTMGAPSTIPKEQSR